MWKVVTLEYMETIRRIEMRIETKVRIGGKYGKEVRGYNLEKNKEYKIVDFKYKKKKVLMMGKVIENYKDHILFSNGVYQECFCKSDLIGTYIRIEEVS